MHADFKKVKEEVMYKKKEGFPDGLYMKTKHEEQWPEPCCKGLALWLIHHDF